MAASGGPRDLTAPVIVGGLVVIGAGSTLLALDGATGETVWYFLAGDTIESSPVVVDGYVFFGTRDGFLMPLRAGDGANQATSSNASRAA